jgi:hypothetical protein
MDPPLSRRCCWIAPYPSRAAPGFRLEAVCAENNAITSAKNPMMLGENSNVTAIMASGRKLALRARMQPT